MNKEITEKKIPISFTSVAIERIKETISNKQIGPEYGLRVGVKGGLGCGGGGMSFLLGFDKPKPDDDHFIDAGIKVLIERKHTMYIIGLQIDFIEEEGKTGFTFKNPDAN